MTEKEIVEKIKNSASDKVKVAVTDIDGVLRGKFIHREKFFSGIDSSYGFCDVIFGWDITDTAYTNGAVTGWHTGYPDAQYTLDLNTYREIPWENNVPFFLGDFSREGGSIQEIDARSLLRSIERQAHDMGYFPLFTNEFEWFNFRENPNQLHEKSFRDIQTLTPGMFGYSVLRFSQGGTYVNDLFDQLEKFNVSLEGLHTETGPGVFEACTHPRGVLEAADQAILLKTGVKEIAFRHGLMASFMAKWNQDLPGCSGHIHQSLWDPDRKRNLFYEEGKENTSSLMKSYLAGQLKCLPYILPMLAPTVNSYKRLVEGAWAPTTVSWGFDNRTTALRVIAPSEKLTRLEMRVSGSDTNPYLSMAASLAAGLYGIRNKLSLDIPPTKGNGYDAKGHGRLAKDLREATELMKSSTIPVELFGKGFVDHFIRTREWEWDQYSTQVSDWELKRYFESI